jgi:hypothetical protein
LRERSRRVNKFSEQILGACVDLESISKKDANKKYLIVNEEVAREALTLLSAIHFRIMWELKVIQHMNALQSTNPFLASAGGVFLPILVMNVLCLTRQFQC